jgi:hypothetical protein
MDGIFYDGDARKVHCAANLDDAAKLSLDSILGAIDRAAERDEVIELYTHSPGKTVPVARLEAVLGHARARGLSFVTYGDLAAGVAGPGIALSFDDRATDAWFSIRPLLSGTRVTFFVSAYAFADDLGRAQLRALADDGHEIAAHSVLHLRAPPYVEDHGLDAYLDDEVVPSIEVLRQDGYAVSSFAYPFGARTGELDDAILEHVRVVRTIEFPYTSSVQSTCPH